MIRKTIIALLVVLAGMASLLGQVSFPSLSPKGNISQIVGNTKVEIEYERPSARNRIVFGNLVPWNQVWRTGAGHCTKISFDKPVVIGGQSLQAGKYSLFTIPGEGEWVVILNADTTLYGSYDYQSQNDMARFIVMPSQTQRFYETLTIDIDLIPNNAQIFISWENTQIHFELLTSTDQELLSYVDERLLSQKEEDGNMYANAAEQLYFMNTRFMDALTLCDIAIEMHKENADYTKGYAHRVKMDIYEKLHQYEKALWEIDQALKVEENESEVQYWTQQKERIQAKKLNE